jgi:TRAP-type C4-dicarboxylate transport system permease small subunit
MDLSLLFTVLVIALSTVGLTWLLSAHWRRTRGNATLWRLVETGAGLFLTVGMLFAAALQIIVRYAPAGAFALPWTEEFSRLFLVWAAFWGAAIVQRSDGHLSMAIVFDLLPLNAQTALRLFGDVVVLAFLGVVVWEGWWTAQSFLDVPTVTLGLPLAVFPFSVPVGGGLMVVHTLRVMIRRIRGQPIERTLAPEV